MSVAKAAVLDYTAEKDCPVLAGPAREGFLEAARSANRFSEAVLGWLQGRRPEEQAAWLRTSVGSSRSILQPYNLEILYLATVWGRARFSQMRELLGLSTRTLSDKLKTLRAEGYLDREVFDEQPVRIEYVPTKHGRRTAALASPLFAHLNLASLRAAGRS